MQSVGVDIIEINRIAESVKRWGDRFLHRIYTSAELEYCRGRPPQLAARFAAKEAVMKALGTGRYGLDWCEIEIVRQRGGPPFIRLHGRASNIAKRRSITHMALSISHSREYALASAVFETG